jgi:hypothetical protein
VFVAAGVPPPLQAQAPDLAEDTHGVVLELLHHPQPGGARVLLHLLQLGDIPLHGCKQRETTHKISHKAGTINSLVPDSKIHKLVSWYRHFIRVQKVQRQRFQTGKKSVAAASTGQEKYNLDSIRTELTWRFQKRINAVFSMTFAVSKSNQIVRIFYYGSGDKLNTVPIIFTGQLRVLIAQEGCRFQAQKT